MQINDETHALADIFSFKNTRPHIKTAIIPTTLHNGRKNALGNLLMNMTNM